jgi:ribosomal protein S20
MSKQAQFSEMHTAVTKARSAINNLDRDFTPDQIGKLTLAMRHTDDPTVFKNEMETFLGTQQLTPAQQDFVVWVAQLNERAMSLRNVAGMGQGSDQLRTAIQATLPNAKSGSKEMALKQLAAFENQLNMLEKGVPTLPGRTGAGAAATSKTGETRPPLSSFEKKP